MGSLDPAQPNRTDAITAARDVRGENTDGDSSQPDAGRNKWSVGYQSKCDQQQPDPVRYQYGCDQQPKPDRRAAGVPSFADEASAAVTVEAVQAWLKLRRRRPFSGDEVVDRLRVYAARGEP